MHARTHIVDIDALTIDGRSHLVAFSFPHLAETVYFADMGFPSGATQRSCEICQDIWGLDQHLAGLYRKMVLDSAKVPMITGESFTAIIFNISIIIVPSQNFGDEHRRK